MEPNESTHLLAEQDGVYARVPKDKVGGVGSNIPMTRGLKQVVYDGNAAGRETVDVGGIYLVRIMEDVLSVDDMIGGSYTVSAQGMEASQKIISSMFVTASEHIAYVDIGDMPLILLCKQDDCELYGSMFNKGVYVLDGDDAVTLKSFEYYGEVISEDVLPQDISCDWANVKNRPFGDDIAVIEWDGNTADLLYLQHPNDPDQRFYKVSSETPSAESVTGKIGHTRADIKADVFTVEDGWYAYNGMVMCALSSGAKIGSWTLPEPGVYFHYNVSPYDGVLHVTRLEYITATHQLDPRFIPSDVGGSAAMVINFTSSDGSTGTIDRTFNEIAAEINAGRFPVVKYQDGTKFPDYYHLNCFFDDGYDRSIAFNNVRFDSAITLATITVVDMDGTVMVMRRTTTLTAST